MKKQLDILKELELKNDVHPNEDGTIVIESNIEGALMIESIYSDYKKTPAIGYVRNYGTEANPNLWFPIHPEQCVTATIPKGTKLYYFNVDSKGKLIK